MTYYQRHNRFRTLGQRIKLVRVILRTFLILMLKAQELWMHIKESTQGKLGCI